MCKKENKKEEIIKELNEEVEERILKLKKEGKELVFLDPARDENNQRYWVLSYIEP